MPPWKTGLIVLSVMISSAIISVVELRKVIGQHREPWQAATLCVTLATPLDARARNPSQHQDDDLYRPTGDPTGVALHLSNTCRIKKIKLTDGTDNIAGKAQATTTRFRSHAGANFSKVSLVSRTILSSILQTLAALYVPKWQRRKSLLTKPSAMCTRTTPLQDRGPIYGPMRFDESLNR